MMTNRELDKWIQEHIMGYTGLKTVYTWYDRKKKGNPIEVFSSCPDKRELGDYAAFMDQAGIKIYCGEPHGIFHIHHYTTSISDAFQVVEKITSKPNTEFMLQFFGGSYVATFGENCGWGQEGNNAPTAPLAICLAARKCIEKPE